MKKLTLLPAVALLCTALQAQQVLPVRANEILVLPAAVAQLHGGLLLHPYQNTDKDPKIFAVPEWKSSDQSFTWTVNIPEKERYKIALLVEVKEAAAPTVLEISSGKNNSRIELTPTAWNRVFFPETIALNAGNQSLHLRMIAGAHHQPPNISVYSLELATEQTWAAKKTKSVKLRSKPSWLNEARYGLFFHWNARSQPQTGEGQSYTNAVENFNVTAFADMVKSTGANFVVLTTSWALPTFPAPLKTLDKLLPGNTTPRDLIADMAGALKERNIQLMVYCNFRMDWMGWTKADNNDSTKTAAVLTNIISLYREIGERYAHKIAGLWIDDGMALYRYHTVFESITDAVKQYDSNMVIGYNSWIYPRFTDFQDFFGGEQGITLSAAGVNDPYLPVGGDGYFIAGPQQGLKATFCGLMEPGDWTHTQPNQTIPPPLLSADTLITIVKEAMRRKNVPVMNIRIYQDGSISPHTYMLLKQLKEAVLKTKY